MSSFNFHPATYFFPVLCRNTETLGFTKIGPKLLNNYDSTEHEQEQQQQQKQITRQDHDHVKGSKLTFSAMINWFPLQTYYVQLIFVITMQCWKKKNIIKAFQINLFLACDEE